MLAGGSDTLTSNMSIFSRDKCCAALKAKCTPRGVRTWHDFPPEQEGGAHDEIVGGSRGVSSKYFFMEIRCSAFGLSACS